MPINSTLDLILENDDIAVYGPPNSIELNIGLGEKGERGSRFFQGSASPSTIDFLATYGVEPIFGDTYLSTAPGSQYGTFYTYNVTLSGSEWITTINMYDIVGAYLNTYNDYVIEGKNGGTGVSNTGKTITLGGNLTLSGANNVTLATSGATNITLPTSGSVASSVNNLSFFSTTTSSQLRGLISDETGTGSLVFATAPTISDPNIIGSASVTNNVTVDGNTLIKGNLTVDGIISQTFLEANKLKVNSTAQGNVFIQWNEPTKTWQFTNDGITYEDVGNTSGFISSFLTMGA